MKTRFLKSALAGGIIVTLLSFTQMETLKKKIDIKESQVTWIGKKMTGEHSGTIQLKDGFFLMENEDLVGGEFTIDMNSIEVTDLSGEDKTNLEGHLKSDDFFGTEVHPLSNMVFKSITKKGDVYQITANLTIKEITHPITFDLKMGKGSASAKFQIDRAKYNVRYGSGSFFSNLGDKTIDDKFDVAVTLKF